VFSTPACGKGKAISRMLRASFTANDVFQMGWSTRRSRASLPQVISRRISGNSLAEPFALCIQAGRHGSNRKTKGFPGSKEIGEEIEYVGLQNVRVVAKLTFNCDAKPGSVTARLPANFDRDPLHEPVQLARPTTPSEMQRADPSALPRNLPSIGRDQLSKVLGACGSRWLDRDGPGARGTRLDRDDGTRQAGLRQKVGHGLGKEV
jgi:hypothetical protein